MDSAPKAFDAGARTLSGTPSEAAGVADYTGSVTDADADEAEQVVVVSVQVVVTFPGADGATWPEVAAVGLCEGADSPVVAWTSRFVLAGETLPAPSPGSGLRITELRLTLFDRSRIVAAE